MRTALALALAFALPACSSAPAAPSRLADDAALRFDAPGFDPLGVPAAAGMSPDDAAVEDRLRPGDVLSLRVLGATGLDQPLLPVDRHGKVHLPLAGDVIVGDKSLDAAERDVETALLRYEKFAKPVLGLVDAKGRTATVVGAVERPGQVPLVGAARVADVLASVGGTRNITQDDRLVPLGDLDATRVVRGGAPLPIDVRLAMQGDPRHNVPLRAGDVMYVPPATDRRVTVLGLVTKPRTFSWHPHMRLTEVLSDAGGPTTTADEGDVRVLRGGLAHPRVYKADLKAILGARRGDVELAPGDVVYVSEHWFATATDVINRLIPAAATGFLAATVAK